jgi:hypothetical protein
MTEDFRRIDDSLHPGNVARIRDGKGFVRPLREIPWGMDGRNDSSNFEMNPRTETG